VTSKAERKRRKKAPRITLPGDGGAVAQRTAQGRRSDLDQSPPPILAARARRCDIDRGSVLHESDMGRCIIALSHGQDRADLGETWAALSAARRNYLTRHIGVTGSPQGAAIAMVPEPMETDPSLRVDLRTGPERDEAAKVAWDAWAARIKALPAPQLQWALRGALDGFMGDGALWRGGEPTASGIAAVRAISLLTDRR
jgi:hypothetical protein